MILPIMSGSSRRLHQEASEVGQGSKPPLGAPACSSASRAGRWHWHWHWGDPGKGKSTVRWQIRLINFMPETSKSWLTFFSNINSQVNDFSCWWSGNAIKRNTSNIILMLHRYRLSKELQLKSTCRQNFICVEICEPLVKRKSNN